MGAVWFYHLTRSPLEAALPVLLEKALERDWRVIVRAGTRAVAEMLDEALWTWRDVAFLPHGMQGGPADHRQPVLLTTGTGNTNGAQLLMLVDGARLDPAEAPGFARVAIVFDGADPEALAAARADWTAARAAGLEARYWAEDAAGRWTAKA